MRVHFLVKILLNLMILQHRFDHEGTISQPIQMIIQISGPYPCGVAWVHQWRGIGLAHALNGTFGDSITVGSLLRHNVEQDDLEFLLGLGYSTNF